MDLEALSDAELSELASSALAILKQRAEERCDIPALVQDMMQAPSTSNLATAPNIYPEGRLVAMVNNILESSQNRHACSMYTLQSPDGWECWSWEDAGDSLVHNEMSRSGKTKRSVCLHTAVPGMLIVQHNMKYDGRMHTRKSSAAWRVEETEHGGLMLNAVANWSPSKLPAPHGD